MMSCIFYFRPKLIVSTSRVLEPSGSMCFGWMLGCRLVECCSIVCLPRVKCSPGQWSPRRLRPTSILWRTLNSIMEFQHKNALSPFKWRWQKFCRWPIKLYTTSFQQWTIDIWIQWLKGLTKNKSALVETMTWHRIPLPQSMMITDAYTCPLTSMC